MQRTTDSSLINIGDDKTEKLMIAGGSTCVYQLW